MSDLTIPRVTVLTGHTSPETAYVVDDYPYGRTLRCKIRYWVHTADKGAAKGHQRFMSETSNPKRGDNFGINKPKAGTYTMWMFLYLDEKGHVQPYGIHVYDLVGPGDVRTRAMGVYDAMTPEQRDRYEVLVEFARRKNPTVWNDWVARIEQLAAHIDAHGLPVLVNNTWQVDGRAIHLSDPAAYVTAARALIAER